jgi:uncharacterized protein
VGPLGPPERTCVGCRGVAGKRELLRIARSPRGDLVIDRLGTAPGRGAYVHRDARCVEEALRRGLARALRVGLSREEAARLRNEIENEMESSAR